MSVTLDLIDRGLLSPPPFLSDCIHYETEVGSVAYGVSQRASDIDVYGFCVPPKELIFPHLAGEILGFGRQKKRFDQYQQHGVPDGDVVWDVTIYSIVRYFSLCMENNPNMLESLFTPQRCVLYASPIAEIARQRRHLFLHKGAWFKFKGFAYSQIHKMKTKNPEGKRAALIEEFGFDVKFAYHAVRLMNEVEQILTEGTLDLERSKEELIEIRQGGWTEARVLEHFETKERELEALYESNDTLPHGPDEAQIKALLLDCLEEAYGSLEGCVTR